MGTSKRKEPVNTPIDPTKPDTPAPSIFTGVQGINDPFAHAKAKESQGSGVFDAKDYENVEAPSIFDNVQSLNNINATNQPLSTLVGRTALQFGANVVSSMGQGLANTFDVMALANTAKNEMGISKNDDFSSTLFGLTSQQMQDWAQNVANNNKIYEKKEGGFDITDPGWWAKQVASAGTGVGMGLEALASTAAIEYLTEGMGTAQAISKLASLGKKILNAGKGAEILSEAVAAAKGLKSAATVYGIMNRTSESRMEAMQTYDQIYQDLSTKKNKDGSDKYTEDQKKEFATKGATRDFNGNMLLLPLDILAFRTMVYNPISSTGTGLIERTLDKITNKGLRLATQFGTEAVTEGSEEGFQQLAQNEGQHYAEVLGGIGDSSTFLQRMGAGVQTADFWNNVAGGVLGSPIIAGTMKGMGAIMGNGRAAQLEEYHKDFVTHIGQMDDAVATRINKYETDGETKKAEVLRRQFQVNKALSALHLDAMTDKDTAFDSHLNFINATLGELNEGKLDALKDLGFNNPTTEQVDKIKSEFTQYAKDAETMKGIYDNVKTKYNRNFVPQISHQHFILDSLIKEQPGIELSLNEIRNTLPQYNELTDTGKQIYDVEHQLQALHAESSRLNKTYRDAEDKDEKNNINEVITNNNEKIAEAKRKLTEVLQTDEYKGSTESRKDNEILGSALRSIPFAQALYNKEHLDNEISLQRKNTALWNNADYVNRKTEQAVSKSRTQAQAQAHKEASTNPKVQQAATQRENEIAATNIVSPQDTQSENNIPGNANLFEEDNSHINNISTAIPVDDESQSQKAPEVLFSPDEYSFENSSEESKAKIKNGVKGLLSKLPDNASFEDLVRHIQKVQGTNVADKIYNAVIHGWEANGKPVEDYEAIYQKIFGNPIDELMEGASQLQVKSEADLTNQTNTVVTEVVAKENKPAGFDGNNQPVYIYKGVITNEASPKMAFTSRLSEAIVDKDEQGNILVSHEYTSDELNQGDYVDSLQLLDPDKYDEGTQMEARIPSNFLDIKIPIYNLDGTKGQAITFGQYVATHNLTPDMQEYKDKVPMILYKKGATIDEKGLAFVHDIGWYHPIRFNQNNPGDMASAISQTRAIRDEVLSGNNKASITITGKRQTTFAGLKTNGELITLKEANPETELTIATSSNEVSGVKGKVSFPNNDTVFMNNSPFKVGQIIEVRRFGKKDGKKSFIGFPVFRDKLDEDSRTSVLHAINIYTNRTTTNPEVRKAHDEIAKHILDTMKLDVKSESGLRQYLEHFIYIFNTEKAFKNEDVESQARVKLAPGTPYISFIAGGNIVFGRAGENAYFNKATNKTVGSYYINPNVSADKATTSLKALSQPNMIGWYEQNVNLDNLNKNVPVVTIARDMKTSVAAPSYKDFVMDRLKTNIRSYNIGTKENPNYVTNIQPVITYDTNKRLAEVQSNEIKVEEIVPAENKIEITPSTTVSILEAEILAQAEKDLGTNLGSSKDELYSPLELTTEQRNEVAAAINRIAGLTPNEQFDIVDFMYNQITSLVNMDNRVVTKEEVDKIVKEAFNKYVTPVKAYNQDKVDSLTAAMEQHPELKESRVAKAIDGYKHKVNKITSIEKNFNVLKEEAYNRVAKYTGITQERKEVESNEENPDISVEDKSNDREIDFWTDILTESPENKLSYSMRRFFGQIREYDKAGNPISGFLGLPTYTGSDSIIRTLMTNLADIPSNFDAMVARLEERKEAYPWMQEAINKLKGADNQKKDQFVTVMTNTSLRMKFTMISFNRRTNSWTTKVYDTNQNGIADSVRKLWSANSIDSDLIIKDHEGNYTLNTERAKNLINTFESWKGLNVKELTTDMSSLWDNTISKVKLNNSAVITPTGDLLTELKTNLVSKTDRLKFNLKGHTYQITNLGNSKFQIDFLSQSTASTEAAINWLKEFGIILSPETVKELTTKGLFHNYKQRSWADLFEKPGANNNGLFTILYNKLISLTDKGGIVFDEEGDKLLDDSVITSLANLESKYNTTETPFGFRDNGKSFFALTAPKFITDRARDLKSESSEVRDQLSQISFSQGSFWLRLLNDVDFRNRFGVSHIGANAFKELGKKLYRDNGITKLSDIDHELTKLGMFWDSTQGEVRMSETGLKTYPGTNIDMRMATMFSPTMSDKHLMTLVTTAVLNFENKDLGNGEKAGIISDDVKKILYEQTIRPELLRMIKFHQNGSATDIEAYDKGAGMFLLMPAMNSIEYAPGVKLIDAIKVKPNDFTTSFIEGNQELMNTIYDTISDYISNLSEEKVSSWESNGFITRDAITEEDIQKGNTKGTISSMKYFDKGYINKPGFRGTVENKVNMAATDYVINSMITNANSFMLMAGDPALYFKSKSTDSIQQAKDTFVNAGKRLANQIAPGTTLSNSEKEKYIQVFIKDRISTANNIAYLKQLIGEEAAKAYENIEASDAQEYTTWQEHLNILQKLGKTPDISSDITPQDIEDARALFASGTSKANLTTKELDLIGKVMQPIKPVYTGQIYDKHQDVMRTIYIKSSSFPLIPQLTAGLEIDKLRTSMEDLQQKSKLNVRASYQTANKVGTMKNSVDLWNEDGTTNTEGLSRLGKDNNFLVLDRKNFRIQQEVPFKSLNSTKDEISLGTQIMKLLFGDGIMNYDDYQYNNQSYTGKDLHKIYNDKFISLVNEKKQQLFRELGLDELGNTIDAQKTSTKLQEILKDEAVKRGYPLQDIEALSLNKEGKFNLPLWASSNSNRYESMLNSIISNRLVRMKMPGFSSVVGSEEGFKVSNDISTVADQSKIIFTSAWNGKELQASYHENGKLKKAQVLLPSKFRDNDGALIDLFLKKGGDYVYINKTDTGWTLKEDMFDKELLSLTSFRIPTSSHQSASSIEIAGFLPFTSGDLMIVPKNFTKQKGLDFDIDKENTYQLYHRMNNEGKFEVLSEKHRAEILFEFDKAAKNKNDEAVNRLMKDIFGDESGKFIDEYTKEDLDENAKLTRINSAITEKLLKNDLVNITHSVMSNPNREIQSKISKTLNTDYAEQQATFIDSLINKENNKYWTPLSDEYQKQKMSLGTSGKIGTGAYSLDVVFHSLVQQARINNKPVALTYIEMGEDEKPIISYKIWKFGSMQSDGILGNSTTIDGGRSITELQTERQNIAVDNEKLQVMGRVNLNDLTMDVDKVFNLLGFDKGEDGNSISFLFLSQPIIREYVQQMKNASSNMSEFELNKEDRIVDDLIKKYEGNVEEVNDEYWERMSKEMTNKNFIAGIESTNPDGKLQAAIIRRFIEMKKYGIAIRNIQSTINTDSKGLGKSFFDVIEKRNALNKLGNGNTMIEGASNLIGDYISKDDIGEHQESVLKKQGYIDIGAFLVKPTTLSGGFSLNGVMTAYNLWSDYFPYDAIVTQKAFDEILPIIANDTSGLSDTKTIDYKQEIFKHIKKYFAASKMNGIIQATDNINEERKRLYIDSEENISLAKYIKSLKQISGNKIVYDFIKSNKLINRFEFDIQKNGQPSIIKYNNAAGEEFDEQYLYESLASLMEVRGKNGSLELPQIGNKKYTLDTLAQDLIAYTYLGNSTQEAIQFAKYIPVAYLNQVGYSEKMRLANDWLSSNPNLLGVRIGDEKSKHLVSEFTMQYIQHNPERVKQDPRFKEERIFGNIIDINQGHTTTNISELRTFKPKDTEALPTFIKLYNSFIPKGEKKFQLYWFDGDKYTKIPVLGAFGMDEYQPRTSIGTSLINGREKLKINPQSIISNDVETKSPTDVFDINSGDVNKVLSNIASSDSMFATLAKELLPFVSELKIEVSNNLPGTIAGRFTHDNNLVSINETLLKYPTDRIAKTILHEVVHGLTSNQIRPFIIENEDGTITPKENSPAFVLGLIRLYNDVRSKSDVGELRDILNKVKTGQGISVSDKEEKYGLTNIFEFMSMSLTEPGFQKYLAKSEFKQSGMSLLDRFKEIITTILNKIGVKFESNTATVHAINSIFEFIENTNTSSKKNSIIEDQAYNDDEGNKAFLKRLDDNNENTGNPEVSMYPSDRDYILADTDSNTHNQIHYSPDENYQGMFAKYIQFRKQLLSQYNNRLSEIKRLKGEKGISTEKLTRLKNLERETNLAINGSLELGIKGIKDQIAELEDNATVEAVKVYAEKDIERLKKLTDSTDVSDLQEAKNIVNFYTLAGTFKTDTINPFFTKEEMFLTDEDGNLTSQYRLSPETMNEYKAWADTVIPYQNTIDAREKELTVNTVNSLPSIIKTYGKDKQFSFDDLTSNEKGLKDTDWISMWTMDITNGIFSHNGLLPQATFAFLKNSFEKKLAWSREIEEKIDNLNPKVQKELMKLGHSLRVTGILGIKGASYNLFKEITKDGNETGGLVQRFVKEFFDSRSKANNDFKTRFDKAKPLSDFSQRNTAFNKAFEELKKWKRNNTIIVDTSRVPEILDDEDFLEFQSGATTQQAQDYKNHLISILGNKGYKEQVEEQKKLLRKYQSEKQSMIDTLLVEESKDSFDNLSDKAKNDLQHWVVNHNPINGYEDYHNVNGIYFGNNKTNNFMDYNLLIPRKFKPVITSDGTKYNFQDSTESTGNYNDSFKEIEDNPILSEFYDTIKEVIDRGREVMPYELQQKMAANTVPGLMKTSSEIINDNNTGILNSLFLAFKHMMDRFRTKFGIVAQSELSYTTIDPITGKASYKVNDGFIKRNQKAVEERLLIEKTGFLQAFNANKKETERVDDIKRFTVLPISRFNEAALLDLAKYVHSDITIADIRAGNLTSITSKTGQNIEIGKYIRDFSLHSVVQSQSFDLGKIAKYYSNMAMMYAARREALPILEIMKKHYEGIQKPNLNNMNNNIYNVPNQEHEKVGIRTNGIRQMDDWFERVVLNNYGPKHSGVLGAENRNGKVPFFGKLIYSNEERKRFDDLQKLIQNETDDKKRQELIDTQKLLGRTRTTTAAFDNLLAFIRTLRLGYNVSSGTTNFMEGVTSNMILAADGRYFDAKEIYYGYNVIRYSFLKNITFGKVEAGVARKNRKLMDKFNVIMDSKNELQKASHKSFSAKAEWLNPHALNQRVEYINQSPIMIAMLRTQKIKGIDGTESSIWDAYNNDGHLKDNFKTEENIKSWEHLSGDDYLNFKGNLHKAIVLGHGNYDEMRGMLIKSSGLGKAAMMFKTWIPMQLYWRFAAKQDDIEAGIKDYKGRYWSYGKGSGFIHGATVGFAAFGPLGAAITGGIGLAMGAAYGTDTGVGLLQETVEATKQLVKKAFGMPINLIMGKQIVKEGADGFNKFIDKGTFTEQDARNLRSNMSDIVIQLGWIAMMLTVKSLFWDDDDDKDSPERIAHNIAINKLMQLSTQAAAYTNPSDMWKSTIGSMAIQQYLVDCGKELTAIAAWTEGKDIISSGANAGKSKLGMQTRKILMPGLFKDNTLGFQSEAQKVFTEPLFHNWFRSEKTKDKDANKRDRAERKLELENELKLQDYDNDQKARDKDIRKILDEEEPTPAKLEKLGLSRDEYDKQKEE